MYWSANGGDASDRRAHGKCARLAPLCACILLRSSDLGDLDGGLSDFVRSYHCDALQLLPLCLCVDAAANVAESPQYLSPKRASCRT